MSRRTFVVGMELGFLGRTICVGMLIRKTLDRTADTIIYGKHDGISCSIGSLHEQQTEFLRCLKGRTPVNICIR